MVNTTLYSSRNSRISSVYKLSLSYVLNPVKFLEDSKKAEDEEEKKVLAYFSALSDKTVSGASSSKKPDINQNGKNPYVNKNSLSIEDKCSSLTLQEKEDKKTIDEYFTRVACNNGILDTIAEHIRNMQEGMTIKGIKPNIIGICEGNMKVVVDLTDKKPTILIFNKAAMRISDRYIETLASRKICYEGYGRNGNKINKDEDGDVIEVHIKYHTQDGASQTIPSTYKTSIRIDEDVFGNDIMANICYFDVELNAREWHEEMRMEAPQYQDIPQELNSLLSPVKEVESDAKNINSKIPSNANGLGQ